MNVEFVNDITKTISDISNEIARIKNGMNTADSLYKKGAIKYNTYQEHQCSCKELIKSHQDNIILLSKVLTNYLSNEI